MQQLTIFDFLPAKKEIHCGYIKEEDENSLIGRELRFTELKNMIGEKCIVSVTTQSRRWYKVIKIVDYWENHDKIYKQVRDLPDVCGIKECMDCYEIDYICDLIAYTDKENGKEAKGWVSESWCSNGRFNPVSGTTETFYEINI